VGVLTIGIAVLTAAPAAGAWSTPVPPPTACGSGSLSVNSAGAWAIAGSISNGDGTSSVNVCTSSDGVNWSGPTTIGQGITPVLAVAPNGRIVAMWEWVSGVSSNVQASIRPVGGNWSTPVIVSTASTHPLISMDGSGNALGVLSRSDTLTLPVSTVNLPANSTTWTTPTTLVAQAGGVGMVTNSSGGAVIGWRTHANQIQAVSGTILGGVGAPASLGSTYGGVAPKVQVALNDAGAAVLGWFGNDFVKVAIRAADGTWGATTQLTGPSASGVGVAIDGVGNAIAAFGQTQQTGTPAYASLRPAGGSWGTPTLVSALNDQGKVAVGGDPAGTFVVIWTNNAGTIEALTIPPGGGFGPGTPVAAGPTVLLKVIPGLAVLWMGGFGAGISKETVN